MPDLETHRLSGGLPFCLSMTGCLLRGVNGNRSTEIVRLLVVEDYEPLRKSLVQGLEEAGFAVDSSNAGDEGLWLAEAEVYDVIILDLMLPGLDGMSLMKNLKERRSESRILILTAKDTLEDRIEGLEGGADDYLVKPFAFDELLARIRALIRRRYDQASPVLEIEDLSIDTKTRRISRAGDLIFLTAREYLLLEYMAMRGEQVVTRDEIWEHLYDFNAEPNSNVIDVHVGRLRRKLEAGGRSRLLHTRRGLGYQLKSDS